MGLVMLHADLIQLPPRNDPELLILEIYINSEIVKHAG